MNERMDGWMDGWRNKRMEGWEAPGNGDDSSHCSSEPGQWCLACQMLLLLLIFVGREISLVLLFLVLLLQGGTRGVEGMYDVIVAVTAASSSAAVGSSSRTAASSGSGSEFGDGSEGGLFGVFEVAEEEEKVALLVHQCLPERLRPQVLAV